MLLLVIRLCSTSIKNGTPQAPKVLSFVRSKQEKANKLNDNTRNLSFQTYPGTARKRGKMSQANLDSTSNLIFEELRLGMEVVRINMERLEINYR